MRLLVKRELLKTLRLIKKGNDYIVSVAINDREAMTDLLIQLQEAAISMGEMIEEENAGVNLIPLLEQYCECLYQIFENLGQGKRISGFRRRSESLLKSLERKLRAETDTEIKIAFFPYKAAMWDSLESICEAAVKSGICQCQVVPIPYYSKDETGKRKDRFYEGEEINSSIPITDYRTYDLEKEKPDIMFIHNPYDEFNRITEVDSHFFSSHLKAQGGILVYVPYYMAGYCKKPENMEAYCMTPGVLLSDYVVLQNEALRQVYTSFINDKEKFLTTGSPKIDYIHKITGLPKGRNADFDRVAGGRKVILFNSGIHTFLNNKDWLFYVEKLITDILNDNGFALIWRPHPLLEETIHSMASRYQDIYEKLKEMIKNADNGILDLSGSIENAFIYSDALISDYSSLVLQYTFTGKPVYLLKGTSANRKYRVFCDYFSNYFKEDGITEAAFLEMVRQGSDPKKEERIRLASGSVINSDGTCGQKTFEMIMKKALGI